MGAEPGPRRVRRVAVAVAAAALAAGLGGCGIIANLSVPSSGPLAVHPKPDLGMDALLEGVLRTDGGCVRVEWEPDGETGDVVPSFPAGDASWDADGVLTWQGHRYVDGDEISLGGGFVGVGGAGGYLPEACEGLEVFQVSPY